MTTTIDIVIYAWDSRINRELEGRFIVKDKDSDGKVRASIGAWLTEVIYGDSEKLQLEDGPGVPVVENTPEVMDATTDASFD